MIEISEERSDEVRDDNEVTVTDENTYENDPEISPGAHLCRVCNKRTKHICGCTLVYYCSREHRDKDWEQHKQVHKKALELIKEYQRK